MGRYRVKSGTHTVREGGGLKMYRAGDVYEGHISEGHLDKFDQLPDPADAPLLPETALAQQKDDNDNFGEDETDGKKGPLEGALSMVEVAPDYYNVVDPEGTRINDEFLTQEEAEALIAGSVQRR